jgi:CRISPR-associated protein Csb2
MPEIPHTTLVPILDRLATELPNFYLPNAAVAHTRHYMPWEKKGPDDRTLVLDSFVTTQPRNALLAIWPSVDLAPEEKDTLARLLANLGYLGRAESWCDAHLVDNPFEANCFPLQEGPMPPGDWEITRVLAPKAPLLLKDLCVETGDLRRDGRIDPPGARWCQYIRSADSLGVSAKSASRPASRPQSLVFRYALAGTTLPLVTDTLRMAELVRQSAMSQYGRANGRTASPILSGKGPDGAPLAGHQHAFYLPTDENGDGRIDHVTVWAPAGLGEREMDALMRVRSLNPGGGRPEIRLAFLAHGSAEDFRDSVPIFWKAREWRSATPFVLNRHMKLRGAEEKRLVDGPADQVRRELDRRPPMGAFVEDVAFAGALKTQGWRTVYPLEFYQWRRGGARGGGAFNFLLRFREPVAGPITLGYGCHFGLGLFTPTFTREGA